MEEVRRDVITAPPRVRALLARPTTTSHAWLLGPLLAYALLALWLTHHLWADPSQLVVADNPHDATQFSWYLTWVPWAVEHGQNPLHSTAMNHPDGFNLMWNTPVAVLGLLLWPLTAAFGAIWTVTLLTTLGPFLSAVSGLLVLRSLGVRRLAAAVVAGFYGFSPAMTAKSLGHINMTMQVLLPVLLLLGYRLAARSTWSPRLAAALGLVASAQVLLNEEMLLYTGLGLGLVLVVLAVSTRPGRGALRTASANYLTALGVFLVVSAPLLAFQLFGPDSGSGAIFSKGYFRVDLASFVTPSRLQQLATRSAEERAAGFVGGYTEQTGYLGWPLVLLSAVALVALWRDLRVRCLLLPAFVVAGLSLGPSLTVDGEDKGIALPWHLVERAPALENALASRLPLITALLLAGALAFALDHLLARGRRHAWVAGALAAAALVPLLPAPLRVTRLGPTPEFFRAHDSPVLDEPGSILVLPFPTPISTDPLRWQATADMSFSMPGGYFIGPADDGHLFIGGQPRVSKDLLGDIAATGVVPAGEAARQALRDDLAYWESSSVVLGPTPHAASLAAFVTGALGQSPVTEQGVQVWRLR